jgi:hypothetical protein
MATVVTRGTYLGLALRVAAVFGPMVAWFAHLNVSYLLVPPSCRLGHSWFLHLATVGFALTAAGCMALAWRLWRSEPGTDLPEGRPAVRTAPFLGFFGLLNGALFLLTIVLAGAGNAVIDPCAA